MAAADLTQALRYGPQTGQLVRRSQYLEDALREMGKPAEQIRSPYELAARLAALAITKRGADKTRDAAVGALRTDMDNEASRLVGALRPPKAEAPPPAPPPVAQTPPMAAAPQAPPPVAQAPLPTAQPFGPTPAAMPPREGPQAAPQDRDALIRMLATEAIGEGPEGMAAAGHVALNRLRSGHMGAKSLRDVVFAPHQFEGMSRANQVSPQDYEKAAHVADAILSGQMPDPTGGAVNFLNPELQAQMGRQQPSWAPQGQGQRIGRHVFYGGRGPQAAPDVRMASGPAPQGPMQVEQGFPQQPPQPVPQGDAQPFQLAANGPMQPGMIPSASGSSPPANGAPPVATPQAAAGGNPQWPTYQPTEEEIGYVEGLMRDPRTFEQGREAAMKLRQKMTQPAEAKIETINGLPFYVPAVPGQGSMIAIPVPPEAMTRTVQTPQGLPQGSVVQQKPTGEQSILYQPQAGYQGAPDRQSYIPGSGADPSTGLNLVAGEGKLRDDYTKELKEYSAARDGYAKVVQAARTGTPAGDIAMIFGYMKTLDPTSTVREGEYATVQNSGTVDQTVSNIYNKLLTGEGSLTPQQRAQYADSARRQFDVYQRGADSINRRYTELAKSYNYEPSRIVREFDPIEPFAPAPGSQPQVQFPAAVNQAHRNMVARREYDAKAPLGSKSRPLLAADDAAVRAADTPANKGKFIIMPNGALAVID